MIRLGLILLLLSFAARAESIDAERQLALMQLLKHDCGSCHGLPPKGGLGPSLMPEALAGKSDQQLVDTIQHGRPGSAMPPWQPYLTEPETQWLVQQLRRGF